MAPPRVAQKRAHKNEEQAQRQRVLIQLELPASSPNWARSVRVLFVLRRILVGFTFLIRVFGLGGAALDQKGGQGDVARHLQELRLPVLKGRAPKRARLQVARVGQLGQPHLLQLAVVFVPARHAHGRPEDREEPQHHNRQAVVAPKFLHVLGAAASTCGAPILAHGSPGVNFVLWARRKWRRKYLRHLVSPEASRAGEVKLRGEKR